MGPAVIDNLQRLKLVFVASEAKYIYGRYLLDYFQKVYLHLDEERRETYSTSKMSAILFHVQKSDITYLRKA